MKKIGIVIGAAFIGTLTAIGYVLGGILSAVGYILGGIFIAAICAAAVLLWICIAPVVIPLVFFYDLGKKMLS